MSTSFTILLVFFFFAIQLTTLQSDFDQLKSEYDTLLQLHKRGTVHDEIQSSTILQVQYNCKQTVFLCFQSLS